MRELKTLRIGDTICRSEGRYWTDFSGTSNVPGMGEVSFLTGLSFAFLIW